MVKEIILLQYSNALLAIVVTPLPIVSEVRLLQFPKARVLISDMPLPVVAEIRPVQSENILNIDNQ